MSSLGIFNKETKTYQKVAGTAEAAVVDSIEKHISNKQIHVTESEKGVVSNLGESSDGNLTYKGQPIKGGGYIVFPELNIDPDTMELIANGGEGIDLSIDANGCLIADIL